ncbi:hypothetical protein EI94DRAFT_1766044 [Lactarius quietus]|nr:hypothetical protein EI94DRAFT_1766044 [Lactarius quietus]
MLQKIMNPKGSVFVRSRGLQNQSFSVICVHSQGSLPPLPSSATAITPPRMPINWGIAPSDPHQPACHHRCLPPQP